METCCKGSECGMIAQWPPFLTGPFVLHTQPPGFTTNLMECKSHLSRNNILDALNTIPIQTKSLILMVYIYFPGTGTLTPKPSLVTGILLSVDDHSRGDVHLPELPSVPICRVPVSGLLCLLGHPVSEPRNLDCCFLVYTWLDSTLLIEEHACLLDSLILFSTCPFAISPHPTHPISLSYLLRFPPKSWLLSTGPKVTICPCSAVPWSTKLSEGKSLPRWLLSHGNPVSSGCEAAPWTVPSWPVE